MGPPRNNDCTNNKQQRHHKENGSLSLRNDRFTFAVKMPSRKASGGIHFTGNIAFPPFLRTYLFLFLCLFCIFVSVISIWDVSCWITCSNLLCRCPLPFLKRLMSQRAALDWLYRFQLSPSTTIFLDYKVRNNMKKITKVCNLDHSVRALARQQTVPDGWEIW